MWEQETKAWSAPAAGKMQSPHGPESAHGEAAAEVPALPLPRGVMRGKSPSFSGPQLPRFASWETSRCASHAPREYQR